MNKNVAHSDEWSEEEKEAYGEILSVFSSVKSESDMDLLFDDMFTEKEKTVIVKRWLLMNDIFLGKSQRGIAAERHLSLCKITRGSKMLKKRKGFVRKYLEEKYYSEEELK